MKFGFKLGKSKAKEINEAETLQETLDEPIPEIPLDAEPVIPHAPLQELSLESDGVEENGAPVAVDEGEIAIEEEGEPIKLVELQPAAPSQVSPVPPPPAPAATPAAKTEAGSMDIAASISNIFNNIEEEENPLANLIKALPDVAATELIDDLKEINDIIKDWQKK